MGRQRPLDRQRAQHRLLGPGEHHEKRIPLGVHLMTIVGGNGGPDQPPVVGQNLRVALPQRLDQPGRPLDIGEHKRDRPARKPVHTPPPSRLPGTPWPGQHPPPAHPASTTWAPATTTNATAPNRLLSLGATNLTAQRCQPTDPQPPARTTKDRSSAPSN